MSAGVGSKHICGFAFTQPTISSYLKTSLRTVIQVISSDEEDITPHPNRRALETSKSVSPAAVTSTKDVIDLTEESPRIPPRKDKGGTRDPSLPRPPSQTLDQSGWEEYRSPIASVRTRAFPPNDSILP